jgi:glycosyltransferase involved in cell wall biosynthesis
MAKIGIITRTKNRPILLQRALDSVLGQHFQDWQHVIVNDGGSSAEVDDLLEQRRAAYAGRVQVIHNPASRGMEAASNQGLAALGSDYVVIHDDDDSLHPDFCGETVAYLDAPPHPSVRGVVTHTQRIIERIDGDRVIRLSDHPYHDWLQTVSLRRMLAENFFAPIAFVFSRAACLEVGAFREDLPVLGDWDFNARFLCRYEIGVITRVLAYYHNRADSAAGAYATTVSAQTDKHRFYDNLLRNDWLRQDIATGQPGKGLIANQARMLWDLAWDLRNRPGKKRGFFTWK